MFDTVAIASNNPGKVKEIKTLLAGVFRRFVSFADLDLPSPNETETTYVGNALIKAHFMARYCDFPVIADDSGVEVKSLNGEPGVHTARYAGYNADAIQNCEKVLDNLSQRGLTASLSRLICVVVYLPERRHPLPGIFTGVWEGQLLVNPMGERHSDELPFTPHLYDHEHNCSLAQMSEIDRLNVSHRGRALAQLRDHLTSK